MLQVDLHLDLHIRPASLLMSTAPATEELAEHVKGIMMASSSASLLLVLFQTLVSITIIDRPLVFV